MENIVYKYLDLSGFQFSGKHAVIDLMREFNGYEVPHFEFEFNLLRVQGGIRDLETALVNDWSPIRSDAAIKRFIRITKRIGDNTKLFKPSSWFNAVGWNYDKYFNGHFFDLTSWYVEQLIINSYKAYWPYPNIELSKFTNFIGKLIRYSVHKDIITDQSIYLCSGERFYEITQNYLNKLLFSFMLNKGDAHTVVMHNSFEPFNPYRSLQYFYAAKSIIVDRDPRDIFVSAYNYEKKNKMKFALNADDFILRHKVYRNEVTKNLQDSTRVLRLKFEDLVLHYEETLELIYGFLEESSVVHSNKNTFFIPEVSEKSIGIWKQYPFSNDILKIEQELSEYIYT